MVRFLAIAAVLATTLTLANPSEAKPGKGGPSSSSSMHQHSSPMHTYSTHHHNWSSWSWNSRYGCYFYFCPTSSCSYYWYAPSSCYYPVTCVTQYPPTQCSYQQTAPSVAPMPLQISTPIQVTNTNTLVNGGTPPVATVAPIPVTPGFSPKGP